MDDDWDLHAVVRGCCTSTATATSATATVAPAMTMASANEYLHFRPPCPSNPPSFGPAKNDVVELPDLFKELQELSNPFFAPKSEPLILQNAGATVSTLPAFEGPSNGLKRPHPKSFPSVAAANSGSASRSKRRKNQFKKVCQVPAESLSSDIWAWRKYGQKPIKGSPYPRGYYRCSSSKGCLARKQVERNRSDPGMFIVTYTAEHNHPAPTHRNSLAGCTRQKPANSGEPSAASGDPSAASNPPLLPSSAASPATSPEDEDGVPQSTSRGEHDDSMEDDEEGEVGFPDVALDDDFFVGLEGLINDTGEDGLLDRFLANFGLSWNTATSSRATAAGGS